MPESGATKARPTQLASVPPNPTKRSSSEGEGKPSTKTKNPVKLTPLGGVQDKSQELPPHVKQSVERLTHVDYFYVHRNDGKAIRYGSGPRVPLRAYKSTSDLKKNYYISATHTDIANALKLSYPPKMFYRTPPLEKILLEDVQPGDDVIVSTGEALHPAYREENDDDVDAAADTRIFQIIDEWVAVHNPKAKHVCMSQSIARAPLPHIVHRNKDTQFDGRGNHPDSCLPPPSLFDIEISAAYCRSVFQHYVLPDGTEAHLLPGRNLRASVVRTLRSTLPRITKDMEKIENLAEIPGKWKVACRRQQVQLEELRHLDSEKQLIETSSVKTSVLLSELQDTRAAKEMFERNALGVPEAGYSGHVILVLAICPNRLNQGSTHLVSAGRPKNRPYMGNAGLISLLDYLRPMMDHFHGKFNMIFDTAIPIDNSPAPKSGLVRTVVAAFREKSVDFSADDGPEQRRAAKKWVAKVLAGIHTENIRRKKEGGTSVDYRASMWEESCRSDPMLFENVDQKYTHNVYDYFFLLRNAIDCTEETEMPTILFLTDGMNCDAAIPVLHAKAKKLFGERPSVNVNPILWGVNDTDFAYIETLAEVSGGTSTPMPDILGYRRLLDRLKHCEDDLRAFVSDCALHGVERGGPEGTCAVPLRKLGVSGDVPDVKAVQEFIDLLEGRLSDVVRRRAQVTFDYEGTKSELKSLRRQLEDLNLSPAALNTPPPLSWENDTSRKRSESVEDEPMKQGSVFDVPEDAEQFHGGGVEYVQHQLVLAYQEYVTQQRAIEKTIDELQNMADHEVLAFLQTKLPQLSEDGHHRRDKHRADKNRSGQDEAAPQTESIVSYPKTVIEMVRHISKLHHETLMEGWTEALRQRVEETEERARRKQTTMPDKSGRTRKSPACRFRFLSSPRAYELSESVSRVEGEGWFEEKHAMAKLRKEIAESVTPAEIALGVLKKEREDRFQLKAERQRHLMEVEFYKQYGVYPRALSPPVSPPKDRPQNSRTQKADLLRKASSGTAPDSLSSASGFETADTIETGRTKRESEVSAVSSHGGAKAPTLSVIPATPQQCSSRGSGTESNTTSARTTTSVGPDSLADGSLDGVAAASQEDNSVSGSFRHRRRRRLDRRPSPLGVETKGRHHGDSHHTPADVVDMFSHDGDRDDGGSLGECGSTDMEGGTEDGGRAADDSMDWLRESGDLAPPSENTCSADSRTDASDASEATRGSGQAPASGQLSQVQDGHAASVSALEVRKTYRNRSPQLQRPKTSLGIRRSPHKASGDPRPGTASPGGSSHSSDHLHAGCWSYNENRFFSGGAQNVKTPPRPASTPAYMLGAEGRHLGPPSPQAQPIASSVSVVDRRSPYRAPGCAFAPLVESRMRAGGVRNLMVSTSQRGFAPSHLKTGYRRTSPMLDGSVRLAWTLGNRRTAATPTKRPGSASPAPSYIHSRSPSSLGRPSSRMAGL
eukprot:Rmarinus@m.23082